MSKLAKSAVLFFLLAAMLWVLEIVVNPSGLELYLLFAAIAASIAFVCLVACCIVRSLRKDIPPYKIFAIADILTGAAVAAYAVYDINHDSGWFSGLFGTLLLIFVIPVAAVLLVIDLVVWAVDRGKKKKLKNTV